MNNKEKSNKIRAIIKELKEKGFEYKIFWNACGMNKTNFYNFTTGKISLKNKEIILLETFLKDNFNIEPEKF